MPHRSGLDHTAVVRAAAELVDVEPADQFSLAQLAALLGVRTPSLYNHISGLAGLRRDLAVLVLTEQHTAQGAIPIPLIALGAVLGMLIIGGLATIPAIRMADRVQVVEVLRAE
ncbi:MAG: hypothetical protein ACR2H5_23115 [Ktedonobacteraceae bacterium]